MSEIIIKPMNEGHVSALAEIEKECFSHPWSEEGLRAELSNENAFFSVAEKDGEVCGYIGSHIILDECYIANIAVAEAFRKQGIGGKLLCALLEKAGKKGCSFVSLEVRKSNAPAISLYNKYGFSLCGERKNFYSDPTENACIMTKEIS